MAVVVVEEQTLPQDLLALVVLAVAVQVDILPQLLVLLTWVAVAAVRVVSLQVQQAAQAL